MSDYLTILAARALNRTDVIQPRLASLFEPPEAYDAGAQDDFGLDTGSDEQYVDGDTLPPAAPAARQPRQARASRPPRPEAGRTPGATQPERVDDTQAPPALSASVRQDAARSVPQAGDPGPAQASSAPEPPSGQPRLARAPGVSRRVPPERLAGAAERGHSTRPSPRAGVPGRQSVPAPDHQPAVAPPGAARPATPGPYRPRAGSADRPAAPDLAPDAGVGPPRAAPYSTPRAQAPAEPRPTPASLPTIRVTIGRLEVRAITPPASPKPPATQAQRAPLLTLDEYLKQRNEGRS